MAKRYGFGVVGLGIGRSHCRRLADEKRARLAAVCDINEERGRQASAEHNVPWHKSYRDLLADPAVDAVIVATPSGMHAEFAIAAARAGKHVLCEKPIDIDLARARRIIAACRAAGVKLQVGFQNRCTADALQTRQDIQAGRIGRPLYGELLRGHVFLDTGTAGSGAYRAAVGTGVRLTLDFFGPLPLEFNLGIPVSTAREDDAQVFSFLIGRVF